MGKITVSSSNFQRSASVISALIAILSLLAGVVVPLYIDSKDKVSQMSIKEMKQAVEIQRAMQKDISELNKKMKTYDTTTIQ